MQLTLPTRVIIIVILLLTIQAFLIVQMNYSSFDSHVKINAQQVLYEEGKLIKIILKREFDKFKKNELELYKKSLGEMAKEIPDYITKINDKNYSKDIKLIHDVSSVFFLWADTKPLLGITDLTFIDKSGKLIGTYDVESAYISGPAIVEKYIVSPVFTSDTVKLETSFYIKKNFTFFSKIKRDSIWISPDILMFQKGRSRFFRMQLVKSVDGNNGRIGYLVADFDVIFYLKNLKKRLFSLQPHVIIPDSSKSIMELGIAETIIDLKTQEGYQNESINELLSKDKFQKIKLDSSIVIMFSEKEDADNARYGSANPRHYHAYIVEPLFYSNVLAGYIISFGIPKQDYIKVLNFFAFAIFGIIIIVFIIFSSRRLLEPLESLTNSASELILEQTRLADKYETGREFLKRSFNSIIDDIILVSSNFLSRSKIGRLTESMDRVVYNFEKTLDNYSKQERLFSELETARHIQLAMIPKVFPDIQGFEIWGVIQPATEVGGDFFDIIKLSNNRYVFVVGDVSGHGVSASLLMSMVHGAIRNQVLYDSDSIKVMKTLNRIVRDVQQRKQFVTLIYGILDVDVQGLTYSKAGHPPALFVKASQNYTSWLENLEGPALGIFTEWKGGVSKIQLESGDSILFYTDGIYEAYNRWGTEFGFEKFQKISLEEKNSSLKNWQESLFNAVYEHIGDTKQQDDLTFLAIKKI
jgi:serine phosphatase RsbU (regulator of sigma subunit)